MPDIAKTREKAIVKLQDNGILPPEIPEADRFSFDLCFNAAIRLRLLNLLPNIRSAPPDDLDQYALREVRKQTPGAEMSDLTPVLDAAVADTIGELMRRPAWNYAEGIAAGEQRAPDPRQLDVYAGLEKAVNRMHAAKMIWSQCIGNGKGERLYADIVAAIGQRFLNRIPGFDGGGDVDALDRNVLSQMREFNEAAGFKDVRRILDNVSDELVGDLKLKPTRELPIRLLKPFRLK